MTTVSANSVERRPATDADGPFLLRLYASTREAELAGLPFTDAQRAAFVEQQFAAQAHHFSTYTDTTFDVVSVDGEPAGRLIVGHWPGREHIADISLLPAFRGRGVGTLLIGEVLAVAEQRGVPATMQVERFNPAQRLYARLGFVPADAGDDPVHRLLERTPAPRA